MSGAPKSFLRSIDIFDKFKDEELRIKTPFGTFLSIFLALFGGFYCSIKTVHFFTPRIYRDLALHPSVINQDDFVNISISVSVDLPCYFLHLDSMDSLGSSQLEINSTANLRRISKRGEFLGIANETLKQDCHPCFGILPDNVCCNSCEQMILLFAFRGMIPHPEEWPQCKDQKTPPNVAVNESCLVKGKISVNKVKGTFHIAPGRNSVQPGYTGHNHDLSYEFPNLELNHRIDRIRFGPDIQTANTPLKGIVMEQKIDQPMMYKYNLIVTQLVYVKNGREMVKGFEYTAMITNRTTVPGMAPGIFFEYAFTPYGVVVNVMSKSFPQYLTSTFGFLAGAFAVVMLFDVVIQKMGVVERLGKKKVEKEVETK